MKKVNHHSYNLPGLTDLAVLKAQAEKRRDKSQEITVVHDHAHEDHREGRLKSVPCNERCLIFEPGFETRPVNTIGVPVNEH